MAARFNQGCEATLTSIMVAITYLRAGIKSSATLTVRLSMAIAVCGGAAALTQQGGQWLLTLLGFSAEQSNWGSSLLACAALLVTYAYWVKAVENRRITELDKSNLVRNALLGLLLGFSLQSTVMLVMYLTNCYTIHSVNSPLVMLPACMVALTSAVIEEVLCRGILFRILDERLGSRAALVGSALLFGLLHIANPFSSVWTALVIAVEAGLLLGAAYVYSQSVWLPVFLHFAWNFTEAGVYGANLSGHYLGKSLLTSAIHGPNLLTGGSFGPENSLQALLVCLTASVVLWRTATKQGTVKAPKPIAKKGGQLPASVV